MSQCQCVKYEPLEEIEVKEENKEYVEYDEKKDDNKVLLEKCKQLELEKEEHLELIRQLRIENEMLSAKKTVNT